MTVDPSSTSRGVSGILYAVSACIDDKVVEVAANISDDRNLECGSGTW